MKTKDAILILGAIAFLALVFSLSLLLGNHMKPQACGCPKVISHNFLWLFVFLAVVFVGSLLFYLFSGKIDSQEKLIDKNIEILYSILDSEEKGMLNDLIKSKGESEQNTFAKKYGKTKAHRILKRLIDKKIVEKINDGRTNIIKLNKFLKKELIR